MTLEQTIEIMNFADRIDVKISIYIQGGRYFVAYLDNFTDNAQRAWRDLRAIDAQICNAA